METRMYLRAVGAPKDCRKAFMKTTGELPPARPSINFSHKPDTWTTTEQRQWRA
jgi:hypothetical protein